jgi:ribosomal protein L11 methyltransferase
MQYSVYEFFTSDEIERAWLISILTDYHFEGFEETSDSLKAYVPASETDDLAIREVLYDNDLRHVEVKASLLEDKNWNEEWERNFEPVIIDKRVSIRAPFHGPIETEHQLVIEPKMSFGTGHHATTHSMVQGMLKEDFKGKSVLDFGSGTGVLAILAEKLGAKRLVAIDNEDWAYNNCLENVERNSCSNIETIKGDNTLALKEKFDIILANINRNVILKFMADWVRLLNSNSILMVSGILESDEKDVINEAQKNELTVKGVIKNNGWVAITFTNSK